MDASVWRRAGAKAEAGDTRPAAHPAEPLFNRWPAILLLFVALAIALAILAILHDDPALPYVGLFFTSLIAGTFLPFLPGSSEMAMAALIAAEAGEAALFVTVAIVANVLGASANYVVGRNIARFADRHWFPVSPKTLARATLWFQRYGIWVLLMAWVPTAGDAMTVAAGLLRADARLFLVLTTIGKGFGHLAVAGGVTWIV
jgi:membrane protein YqaA with SNARE-associated domain